MTEHVANTRGAGSPEPHVSRAWDTPLLLGVTAACGGTFVATKDAVLAYSAAGFLAGRFGLAVLVLALAYALQTLGLRGTKPTNAGLISGLLVVIAPLADHLHLRVRARRSTLVAGAFSVAGLALLIGAAPAGPTGGGGLVLLSTAALGVYVALLPHFVAGHDAQAKTGAQMLAVRARLRPHLAALRPGALLPAVDVAGAARDRHCRLGERVLGADLRPAADAGGAPGPAHQHGVGVRGPLRLLARGDRLTPPQLLGGLLVLSAVIAGAQAGTRGTGERAVSLEGRSYRPVGDDQSTAEHDHMR